MRLRDRFWPGLGARSIWLDAALALAGAVTIAVGAVTPEARLAPDLALVGGTALVVVSLFLFRRSRPLVAFAVAAVACALVPELVVGLMVATYAVGRYVPHWWARIGAGVVGSLAVVQPWLLDSWQLLVGAVVTAAFAVLLPGAVGAWVRTRAELLAALRERAERAEAERELLARDAVLTERTRIAREMHDAVGHRVTLMVLQAGAIEMAAGDRGRVEQLAEHVQVAGRQALDELRQAVGVLRSGEQEDAPLTPQPGLDDLERLVAECRGAGMDVELRLPMALDVDPVTSRAAYRIAQEGLTNAGKHAPGGPVTIEVRRQAQELAVHVRNGAGRPVDDAPGGGFGLVGLRERVRTLGGRLRAERRLDGGFEVEAVLPLAGGPEREPAGQGPAASQAVPGSGP